MLKALVTASIAALLTGTAFAGPVDDANAHFKAIAAGDAEAIAMQYAPDAVLVWIGGPLDGRYAGAAQLREVWAKFAKQQGEIELAVGRTTENANPKGATVTAEVLYNGNLAVKVRHVLAYREGRIVNEIWQIDPKLVVNP